MPQIIVTADKQTEGGDPPIMFRERVSTRDFESQHFAKQLVERIGWAVGDADAVERDPDRRAAHEPDRQAAHEPDFGSGRQSDLEPDRESERDAEFELEREPDIDSLPMPALSPVVPRAW